ncbi:hypothetical protein D6850_16295 [Roseovarius spongiae]|uniref:Ferrochelatase n=1 Tax=Roseovarius spongiae TaxID=2320272 RepID=A0A3A8AR82_9RHOB|nr:hypothetical protein [Roseovarius spongiae]RKF13058.1 hypothetical protein D6850_16295 [Roseovarius spongiae]
MKKLTTFAAAAALAAAAAAPVAAKDVSNDPFVSTQGSMGMNTAALVAAGVAVGIIAIAAIDASDDT